MCRKKFFRFLLFKWESSGALEFFARLSFTTLRIMLQTNVNFFLLFNSKMFPSFTCSRAINSHTAQNDHVQFNDVHDLIQKTLSSV